MPAKTLAAAQMPLRKLRRGSAAAPVIDLGDAQ